MNEKCEVTEDPWVTQPEVIKKFLELRPKYEDLCREVEYILSKRIRQAGIEVSAVISRAKTLDSFLDKFERKPYQSPFVEIQDFAGVRVVCLYQNDIDLIDNIVGDEFEIIEKVDKLTEKETDQFGYGAIHYIVHLGRKSSGARYDDLKRLLCEVQVRTVLQDAWAIIEHHLVYKNEAAVPKTLQRKLNSLSGLFETADDQFQQIRDQRIAYVDKVRDLTKNREEFLNTELNLDSFREYLQWRFPEYPVEAFDGQLGNILSIFQKAGYQKLRGLDDEINEDFLDRALDAFSEMSVAKAEGKVPSSALILCALSMGNKDLLVGSDITHEQQEIIRKHRSGL